MVLSQRNFKFFAEGFRDLDECRNSKIFFIINKVRKRGFIEIIFPTKLFYGRISFLDFTQDFFSKASKYIVFVIFHVSIIENGLRS